MDIISRLKTYLESMNISNSQFADTCGIPRPTLSQLLNGRNKKISDEIISKIHDTYPSLSVLWLLFGEGEMVNDENIAFSEGKNDQEISNSDLQCAENKTNRCSGIVNNSIQNIESNKKQDSIFDVFNNEDVGSPTQIDFSTLAAENNTDTNVLGDSSKRITNIVVFYSDNSFQSFKPSVS